MKRTMIDRFGSEQAWKEYMRGLASQGGTQTHKLGHLAKVDFAANRERARTAGARGGSVSRRGLKTDQQ